ncbi:hypothetical protein HNY73_017505 [Argiope bruennichi]|uniref:FHOD1 N-terminal GTPase-binding domain-containing protein n=1 Tax=Argiope bruennichi TaxID=94029 RepID=A0A8T0E9W3_ARGBR|nr:hypothetical protein HNY73_017505 [Argiope bruennichi]
MAYYGTYGSYLTSGAAHGTPSPNRNAFPTNSHLTNSDRSPSRTSDPYGSPYPRTWQMPKKATFYCKRPSFKEQQHSSDRNSRFADYHNSYSWTKDIHRSLSPCYGDYSYLQKGVDRSPVRRSQKSARTFMPSSNTVWTDLSKRFPKVLRYSSKTGESYKKCDATYASSYNRSNIPEASGGWRARLAQQGYVASTRKIVRRPCLPERKWHYLDDEEAEEEEAGYEYRTSRGTLPESDEQQHDSVISRMRRMKLQKLSDERAVEEIAVQVDEEDMKLSIEQEERRAQRSFISSRHHSWYDTVPINYKKYLSPIPWRGTYISSRYSRMEDPENKETSPNPDQADANKDFRKSVLNVDLSQTEAELFAQRQAETRWRKAIEDSYCTSEDGSPSETGYDSSYTDADRSSCETEGFFTDSLDRSYTYRSSQRSSPLGEDAHFLESAVTVEGTFFPEFKLNDQEIQRLTEQFADSTDLTSDADAEGASDAIPHGDIIAENLCFRFKSLTEESSQRDSGFSEVYNNCDSPSFNVQPDQVMVSSQQQYSEAREDVISGCCDVDQLLMDKDMNYTSFQTFEDFDRMINLHKSNVRTRMTCNEDALHREPMRLDLQSCSKFIGKCHDIDEMLGMPTPLSPDSEDTTLQDSRFIQYEEEADGGSTIATSIIGGSDIANLAWVVDQEEKKVLKIPQRTWNNHELDDCTLQLYRYNGCEGDYGNYLDPESTIDEQAEDFEDFHNNPCRKSSLKILKFGSGQSIRFHPVWNSLGVPTRNKECHGNQLTRSHHPDSSLQLASPLPQPPDDN